MPPHRCPWWLGYFLASPIRKFGQNPEKILGPHIRPGMLALDIGCGMGFFSIPLARLVGPQGKVVCVDIQPQMLQGLKRRAAKAGVVDRLDIRLCGEDSLGIADLAGKVDFALAFAVAHEIGDTSRFLREVHNVLVPDGALLLAEPVTHVKAYEFAETVALAEQTGFVVADRPTIRRSRAVLLK